MPLKAVIELAMFTTNAVTQAVRLIALAGQGLNWIKYKLSSQHLKIRITKFDPNQKFIIGGSLDGSPMPNSTIATIGEVLSDQNHREEVKWLTVSCLVETCSDWSTKNRKALAAELSISEPKYFQEPVLEAAILRRNDYIHNLGDARCRLDKLGPFMAIQESAPIRISQDELRDFRAHIASSLLKVESGRWVQFAVGNKSVSWLRCQS